MKRISVIGAAALAALALSAGVGTASASAATVLCDSPTRPCPANEVLPAGSSFAFGAGELRLSNGLKLTDLRCSGYFMASTTTAASGNPLPANGHSYFWNCWHGGNPESTECSVSTNNTTNTIHSFWGSLVGWVAMGTKAQPLQISFKCTEEGSSGVQECTYSAADSIAVGVYNDPEEGWIAKTGSTPPTLSVTGGNGTCGGGATLEIDALLPEESFISTN